MEKIKCIIWDLDDTLWQGTIKENFNVKFSDENREIIKKLDESGILQSIASRNEEDIVFKKLNELNIKEYFLYPQCSIGSKVDSIKKIVEKLNIGMDSIAFIDDNDFELFEVEYFLPEVRLYKASEVENLINYPEFTNEFVTDEAKKRREFMINRDLRDEASKEFKGSREDFLRQCNMNLNVRIANSNDLERIFELSSRTNQLNSMLERVSKDIINSYLQSDERFIFVAELNDRFGYHGIIGVCFIDIKDLFASIKLFCISCRIEGRGIGASFLASIIERLYLNHKIDKVYCNYKIDKKNRPALILLKFLNFKLEERVDDYSIYFLNLSQKFLKQDFIRVNLE